jgi:hypothetical protein
MSFLYPELTRRNMMVGTASAAAAGLSMTGCADATTADLDLDDAETNLNALLKYRADTSGADVVSAFPGECWAMIPNEGNFRLFKTYGIGASHIEQVEEGWRIYHREVYYYLDADTGEVLQDWYNPFIDRKVDVFQIANDPVNGVFKAGGPGVLSAPYPYVKNGDDLIFQWHFYIYHKAAMSRKDYPLYSASDMDQHAELWGIQGKVSDVVNPEITSAPSTTSWSRVAQWIPFMEMGNRPGFIVNHAHSFKMMNGFDPIPRNIMDYTEKHHPEYFESPKEWKDRSHNESSYSNFKEMIDAKNAQEG